MKRRIYLHTSLVNRLLAPLARLAGVAFVTFVSLLCLPFLDLQNNHEPKPLPRVATEEPARVGVKLRRGETLSSLLVRFGVEPPSARVMLDKVGPWLNPQRIQPGQDVQLVLSRADKTVQGMELVVDEKLVRVKATTDGWLAERHQIPFVRGIGVIHGTIEDSLYQSSVRARLTPKHIAEVAKIFEYDIDFFSDFRRGDAFSFVLEELRYADGRRVLGRILAAALEAGDEIFRTFYYVGRDGHGGYMRISSPFSFARQDPIFRTVRPHMAIDYAAPAGTPVIAIGRGQVAFVGWRNGYGNVVDILHSGGYRSRYAHFSRFAKGLRQGRAVNAGDVIGYVGQTGHATGPHLHFEFLRGGEKINFLSVRVPKNERLAGQDLQRFRQLREERGALLRGKDNRVARGGSQGF
jgi:murein DD-endopeptidase MepM/ murein hydrolase activator NlpD